MHPLPSPSQALLTHPVILTIPAEEIDSIHARVLSFGIPPEWIPRLVTVGRGQIFLDYDTIEPQLKLLQGLGSNRHNIFSLLLSLLRNGATGAEGNPLRAAAALSGNAARPPSSDARPPKSAEALAASAILAAVDPTLVQGEAERAGPGGAGTPQPRRSRLLAVLYGWGFTDEDLVQLVK